MSGSRVILKAQSDVASGAVSRPHSRRLLAPSPIGFIRHVLPVLEYPNRLFSRAAAFYRF